MLTIEKVLFLEKLDLFSDLSPRELGHVARIAREVTVPAGSVIFQRGDFGDSFYVIVGGEVKASRDGEIIATLHEPDYFGEIAVLTGETRTATIEASADCLLLRIGQSDFHEMLADNFNAVLSVIRTLCRRLSAAETQ